MVDSSSREIAITCPGLVTPAGLGLRSLWEAQLSGRAIEEHEQLELKEHTLSVPVARVPDFSPADHFGRAELRRMDRLHQLGIVACRETVDQFHGPVSDSRTGLIVGSANRAVGYLEEQYRAVLTRPSRVNPLAIAVVMGSSLTGYVSQELEMTGPSLTVNAECATGLAALATAVDWLVLGRADRVIVGGADASIFMSAASMFTRMGAVSRIGPDEGATSRPFDATRAGFVMGEGAAFAVVEWLDDAVAQSRDPVGIIAGCSLRTDSSHLIAPDGSGASQQRVIRSALAASGTQPSEVVSANAHATSTPANDAVEANAIAAVLGTSTPITATKGTTGHMFAASGLAEALIACKSAATGIVPPVCGLRNVDETIQARVAVDRIETEPGPVITTSFGFGGHDACAVVKPLA